MIYLYCLLQNPRLKSVVVKKTSSLIFNFKNGVSKNFKTIKIISGNDGQRALFPLNEEDLNTFSSELIDSCEYIIEGRVNVEHFISETNYDAPISSQSLFSQIFKEYAKRLKAIMKQNPSQMVDHTSLTDEACFVYLMKDLRNGLYKIGISKKPSYREKTLQSEQPSIESLGFKQFPSRKFALAFEKALHETYSKNRIRGEWFKLDVADVNQIVEMLSA